MKHVLLLLLLVYALVPLKAHAEEKPVTAQPDLEYAAFMRLPVQNEGRIKPLDSFARAFLKSLSGGTSVDGKDADSWLAETIFDPAHAAERRVFRLYNPAPFGLPQRAGFLYTYGEVSAALQARQDSLGALAERDEKDWSEDERELARVQELSVLYGDILRSFFFMLPLDIAVPDPLAQTWKLKSGAVNLQMLEERQADLRKKMADIVRRKGKDPARYTPQEAEIAAFAFTLDTLTAGGANNSFLRIIPGGQNAEWVSPARARSLTLHPEYLGLWQSMATAYRNGDDAAFQAAARNALSASGTFRSTQTVGLEIAYNKARPLDIAAGLYFASFLSFIAYGLRAWKGARTASLIFLCGGAIIHACAIILRVIILSRPPVGTLYESVLFVALVCALIAAVLEIIRKDGTGIAAGSVSALVLLSCARGFADEDSLQVLVAVLNTNFWLATHVLCITMGYGWCLIAAVAAHAWLFLAARGRDPGRLDFTIKTLALIALFFTAFGTILGGIWADQSWGRFWGWDPKENGALLIVLWLVWLLHGRIGGQVSRLWFMGGMAALTVIVALAWFGVNLLGTGLHSYGFITGVAAALGTFCAVQLGAIAWLVRAAHVRMSI